MEPGVEPGVVVGICNCGTGDVEVQAGESEAQGNPHLYNKLKTSLSYMRPCLIKPISNTVILLHFQ